MRTAIYARVSDFSRQGNNFSVDAQLDHMRKHVEAQGWTVACELREKESAYHDGLERTELTRVLDMGARKEIDALFYFSADRFTRDTGDGVLLRRDLARMGVKLFCFWPTPTQITKDNELINIIIDYQNQQFIDRLRQFSMMGIARAIEEGRYPQGTAPFGYRIEKTSHGNFLKIDEEAGWVIHDIYGWYYYHGMGTTEIAERLNEAGYRPNTQGRGSGKWTNKRVIDILGNETYSGFWYAYRYKTVGKKKFELRPREEWRAIPVPAIVSRSLWENVQEKLRSRHAGRKLENQYLMSGRIKHSCGIGMSGKPTTNSRGQKFLYYRCNSANTKGEVCSSEIYFPAPAVDQTVWQVALELIADPDRIIAAQQELEEEDKEKLDRNERQIRTLGEKIAELSEQLETLIDHRSRTKVKVVADTLERDIEELGEAIEELENRKSKLEEELADSRITAGNLQSIVQEIEGIREVYSALHAIEESADFSAMQALINLLDLKATLRTDEAGKKWVDVHFAGKGESREVSSISRRQKPLCSFRRTILTFSRLLRVERTVVV